MLEQNTRKDVWITGLSGKKYLKYKYNDAYQCTLMTLYPGTYNTYCYYDSLGRVKEIPNLVDECKYTASNQILRIEYMNDVIDTISYDNRLRPTRIKAYKSLSTYLDLSYKYQANSNIDSIIDNKTTAYTQVFSYDSLSRLIKGKRPSAFPAADSQWFDYDKVGNRIEKNGKGYTYYSGTNKLNIDSLQGIKFYYDDNGNMIKRCDTSGTLIDSFAYDWNNRLIYYTKDSDTMSLAYNASGLRVKKHYHENDEGGDGGNKGLLFYDTSEDLGIKSSGNDSTYNKGRDIEKIYVKSDANYITLTIVNKYFFSTANKVKLFITLDLDTIANSGNISLPEDSLTRVPTKAAWEYCVYIDDSDYGYYQTNGTKVSKPFGMAVQKVTGDSGSVQVKISRQLMNNVPAIRYTVSTFDPTVSNSDSLLQGGSSAADVYPGTNATFGGEINGYGEITTLGIITRGDYTIFYVYDGINPIVEYSPNGSILARYVYVNGQHIAKIAGADTHFYHCDALGSARVMTNESATVQWQAWYWPFGEMTQSGFADNTHGFTGKEWDVEMGLNYFCQRYYDPEIGRFITSDPLFGYIGFPQSQNRYSYCINNPLKYIDPLGLMEDDPYMLPTILILEDLPPVIIRIPILPIMARTTGIEYSYVVEFGGKKSYKDKYWEYFKHATAQDRTEYSNTAGQSIAGKGRGGLKGGDPSGASDTHLSQNFSLSEFQRNLIKNIMIRIGHLENSSGYIDVNFSVGKWLGGTGGVMFTNDAYYPYVGLGVVTPGAGVSVTRSSSEPVPGWNVGVQGMLPIIGIIGFGGQFGYSYGEGGGNFTEVGPGTGGASFTVFHAWKCTW